MAACRRVPLRYELSVTCLFFNDTATTEIHTGVGTSTQRTMVVHVSSRPGMCGSDVMKRTRVESPAHPLGVCRFAVTVSVPPLAASVWVPLEAGWAPGSPPAGSTPRHDSAG